MHIYCRSNLTYSIVINAIFREWTDRAEVQKKNTVNHIYTVETWAEPRYFPSFSRR